MRTADLPEQALRRDLDEIYLGNLKTVDANLVLPQSGRLGSRFTWKSGDNRFLSDSGTVTRPPFGFGNRTFSLTVCAEFEGERKEKTFSVTILEEPKHKNFTEVLPVNIICTAGEKAEPPQVVIVKDSEGIYQTAKVTWNAIPKNENSFSKIFGSVENTKLPAVATIRFAEKNVSSAKPIQTSGIAFDPGSIHLLEGSPFYTAQENMADFLLHCDVDQMLYSFRKLAGLSTKGAAPMTGWDSPNCNLRGHTTGHYLSALALAWQATGQNEFRARIESLTEGLQECQKTLPSLGYREGYLSAFPEEQFDLLENNTTYPTIWAPYYTLDKIMSGLYDCYTLAGSQTALEIESKMGDWVFCRLSRLTPELRKHMWSMYIAGEYGCMISTMVRLYRETGKKNHLSAAYYFCNEKLFYPMSVNIDTLTGMHVNQHIPQIIGSLELYKQSGSELYHSIAENFWQMVTQRHLYSIGGVGELELFLEPDKISASLSGSTAESCASYNMMRLTYGLFELKPEAKKIDYLELALYNHILSSFSHAKDGGTTYFMPTQPGGHKLFDTDENTCCHGTGMESRMRYLPWIYLQEDDRIYVNLYIPSRLDSTVCLCQNSESIEDTALTVNSSGQLTLCLRVPEWAKADFRVSVCGKPVEKSFLKDDGYLHIPRRWVTGDLIAIHAPYSFHLLKSPDNPSVFSIAYGPYILAAVSEEKEFLSFPADERFLSKHMQPTKFALHFKMDGIEFMPLWEINHQVYHIYFQSECNYSVSG